MIADYDGDISTLFEGGVEEKVPFLITPLLIGRSQSLSLIEHLKKNPEQVIAIFCQKNVNDEVPSSSDIFEWGVYARLLRTIDIPENNNVTAIFQALGRCHRESVTQTSPFYEGFAYGNIEQMPESAEEERQLGIAVRELHDLVVEYINTNEELPNESEYALKNIHNDVLLTNFICTNTPISMEEKFELLKVRNMYERVIGMLKYLHRDIQLLEIRHEIRNKTREDLDEQQREYFLQQQIKNIKQELGNGEGSPERKELLDKANDKKWNIETKELFMKAKPGVCHSTELSAADGESAVE